MSIINLLNSSIRLDNWFVPVGAARTADRPARIPGRTFEQPLGVRPLDYKGGYPNHERPRIYFRHHLARRRAIAWLQHDRSRKDSDGPQAGGPGGGDRKSVV